MFRLIIVDDEIAMHKILNNILNWDELNIEIAGSFSDGKSALEFIENNKVDIVLTDIKMSPMTGLELAKQLHEKHPDISVVVMSAYRDFEYAHTSIKYQVYAYILKPITYTEFYNVFSELSNTLSQFRKLNSSESIASDLSSGNSSIILSYVHNFLSAVNSLDSVQIDKHIEILYNKFGTDASTLTKLAECLHSELCSIYGNKIINSSVNNIKFLHKTYNIAQIREIVDELVNSAIELRISAHAGKQALPVIEQAIRYIDEHCHEQITRNDVAKHVSLSSEYFSRYFHSQTNETFSSYLKNVRIRKAKYLLRNTNLKIKEISMMCGIKKERYFSKLFKQCTDLSPLEYKKAVLNSKNDSDD